MSLQRPVPAPPSPLLGDRPVRRSVLLVTIVPWLLLVLGLGLIQYFDLGWPGLGSVLGLLALYFLLLKYRWRVTLIGPLGYYEMIRLARHGWTTWLRCLYAAVLLLVLAEVYRSAHWAHADLVAPGDLARLAERFVMTVLFFSNIIVLLLTPVYLCGAVIEERRRRTLDFLFTSHLTDSEIILGKLWARCGMLALLLLTGVPLFGVIQFWGGVDPYLLGGGIAVTLITLVHVGSLSLYASTTRGSTGGALALTYTLMTLLMSCCSPAWLAVSPFGFLMELEESLRGGTLRGLWWLMSGPPPLGLGGTHLEITLTLVLEYFFVHGFSTLLWLTLAVLNLRHTQEETPLVFEQIPAGDYLPPSSPYASRPPFFWLPISEDNPLLRKEVYANLYSSTSLLLEFAGVVCSSLVLAVVVGLGLDTALSYATRRNEHLERWVGVVGIFNVLLLTVICLAVLLRASSAVSREREANTLETLLTLPLSWNNLLRSKWLGSIWRFQLLLISLLILWSASLFCGALHPLSFVLLVAMTAVHLAFCASYGLWLSVICPTTTRANLLAFTTALLLVILPLWLFFDIPVLVALLNPTMGWWTLPFSWADLQQAPELPDGFGQRLLGTVLGLLLYALVAMFFWGLAWKGFRATALKR